MGATWQQQGEVRDTNSHPEVGLTSEKMQKLPPKVCLEGMFGKWLGQPCPRPIGLQKCLHTR